MTVAEAPAVSAAAPLRPLYITSGAAAAIAMIYAAMAVEPSGLPALFVSFAPIVSLVMWLRADARLRRISMVFDWGLLALLTWPVLVPWYVFSTRGRAGWRLLGKVAVALVLPWIGAILVLLVLTVFGVV